jgi:predicted phage terminase large subunit-like protein
MERSAGTDLLTIETYVPTKKQEIFHNAPQKYKLYGGAMGGGKSVALCVEAIRLSVEYPGNVGYICRKTFRDFKKSTLVTLMDLLPTSLIERYNKVDGEIHLVNGSLILCGDLEQTEKLKSLNLGWFGIDEASEASNELFLMLSSRLRMKLPNIQYYGLLTSNPEPGWLKDRFVDPQIIGRPKPNHLFIPSLPSENPHLPEGYLEDLIKEFPPLWRIKYLEGSWDVFDSQIFKPDWFHKSDLVNGNLPEMAAYFVAVDPAIGESEDNDETSITTVGIDYDNIIHEVETRTGRWSFNDIVMQCEAVNMTYKPDVFGVEYVAFQKALGDVLSSRGVPVAPLKADRDKVRRAIAVTDLMEKGRVKINTYKLQKQMLEFPNGEHDDSVDSMVYCLKMVKTMSQDNYLRKKDRYIGLDARSKEFWKSHDEEIQKILGNDETELEKELLGMIDADYKN